MPTLTYSLHYTHHTKGTYEAFFWVLIDLIIELLPLIIKPLDNQTEIFGELDLIIKPLTIKLFEIFD